MKQKKQSRYERLRLYRQVKEIVPLNDSDRIRFLADRLPEPTEEEMGF